MTELITYISDTLGFSVKPVNHTFRPEIMNTERFRKYKVESLLINGEQTLLVSTPANKEVTGKRWVSDFKKICRFHNDIVIMWLSKVDFALRKTLVANQVNFVVVGTQLHIPSMFISLREKHLKDTEVSDNFSTPAQVVLIYHLVKQSLAGMALSQVAKLVGYSPKTLSLVVKELEAKGVVEIRRDGRTSKYMHFFLTGRKLWNAVKGKMVNPIVKTVYSKRYSFYGVQGVYCSGKDAYKEHAYGNDHPSCKVVATTSEHYKTMDISIAEEGQHSSEIQVWRYDPGILATNGLVDPCSLYLTMRDSVTPQQARNFLAFSAGLRGEIKIRLISWATK